MLINMRTNKVNGIVADRLGLWGRLGRRKMTNMSFFNVFKAPSFALVNSASQSNATGLFSK